MLKLCSTLVLYLLLISDLTICDEATPKNNVNYTQTESTAALNVDQLPKGTIQIIMEGQPPSSKPIKVLPTKHSTAKEIVKKGSKTVPRKGVLNKLNEKNFKNDTQHDLLSEKSVEEKLNLTSTNSTNTKQVNQKNFSTLSTSAENLKPVHVTSVKEGLSFNSKVTPSSSTTKKKPKPKPIVTVGGKEPDGPIPASPTSKSPLIPTEIDYIVPVIITITALPLLGIVFYALYKRGRDYWSKRHYRRMDFLIDGMYNE